MAHTGSYALSELAFLLTADKYKDPTPEGAKDADNAAKNTEPLINLDGE